jgi:formate hydrogenlyase subunit 4
MQNYLLYILQIILVPVLSPLFVGIINSIKAKIQKRQGPSIFQQYKNIWKMIHKDEVISSDASWVTRIAPYAIFAITILVGASIPLFSTALNMPTGELLTVVYMLALSTFLLAILGMDAGGAFGGFGSSREVAVSALAEGVLIFSCLPLIVLCGTTDLNTISQNIAANYGLALVSVILALCGFIVALLAETKRFPFDNPDTHLELTMIHEAMIIECSGKRLAMMEWSAANKLFIFAALASTLFFPIGIANDLNIISILIGITTLFAKVLLISIFIAILESSISKLRFFRLPDLLFTAFVINIVALGLII